MWHVCLSFVCMGLIRNAPLTLDYITEVFFTYTLPYFLGDFPCRVDHKIVQKLIKYLHRIYDYMFANLRHFFKLRKRALNQKIWWNEFENKCGFHFKSTLFYSVNRFLIQNMILWFFVLKKSSEGGTHPIFCKILESIILRVIFCKILDSIIYNIFLK